MKSLRMVTHLVVAICTVVATYFALGAITSCKSTLPAEPDAVVYPPDEAGAPIVEAAPPPSPSSEVNVIDGAAPASCMQAAENLHLLGCAGADDAGAFAVQCAHAIQTPGVIRTPTGKAFDATSAACLANAKTKAAAVACGGIVCP